MSAIGKEITKNEWRRFAYPNWRDSAQRGLGDFNHFYFCYIHPESSKILLLCIRMEMAVAEAGNLLAYYCPMLGRKYVNEDFRPDVRREVQREVGIPYYETRESCQLCPRELRATNFLTNQVNHKKNDISDAWWLPQPMHLEWKRYM